MGIQAVGVILTYALLVTPTAAASLLTDSFPRRMLYSALIAAASAIDGLVASYRFHASSGAGGVGVHRVLIGRDEPRGPSAEVGHLFVRPLGRPFAHHQTDHKPALQVEGVRLEDVRAQMEGLLAESVPSTQARQFAVIPESTAPLMSYLRSPTAVTGLYLLADMGAGQGYRTMFRR